jgi:hypothetical protein
MVRLSPNRLVLKEKWVRLGPNRLVLIEKWVRGQLFESTDVWVDEYSVNKFMGQQIFG